MDRIEAARERELGNVAAMREALKSLMDNLQIHAMMPCEQITMNRAEVCAMIEDCRAALAAKPRNCDRFADWRKCVNYLCKHFRGANVMEIIEWLYASATEGGPLGPNKSAC